MVNVTVLNAANRLENSVETAIRDGVADAVAKFSAHLPIQQVDIIVQLYEFGIHARTFGPESVTVYVNPNDTLLLSWTKDHFSQLVAHELHHVLRWRSLSIRTFDDWTPGEILVLEGLATNCELFLGYPTYDSLEIDDNLIEPLLCRLRPDVGAKYSQINWLDSDAGLSCTGMRAANPMGHLLVRRFLEQTEGATPISALAIPWQEVWETVMGFEPR